MDKLSISKADAIGAYAGNAAALARALNITPSAVYQWPDGPIAEGYALKLRYVLKPDTFDPGTAEARPSTVAEGSAAETTPAVPVSKAA